MTKQPNPAAARQWPQYRKFSAAPSRAQIAARSALAAVIALSICMPWMLEGRVHQGPGVRPTAYVQLDRVEIVGKRERPAPATAAQRPVEAADPSLVKLVRDHR